MFLLESLKGNPLLGRPSTNVLIGYIIPNTASELTAHSQMRGICVHAHTRLLGRLDALKHLFIFLVDERLIRKRCPSK